MPQNPAVATVGEAQEARVPKVETTVATHGASTPSDAVIVAIAEGRVEAAIKVALIEAT